MGAERASRIVTAGALPFLRAGALSTGSRSMARPITLAEGWLAASFSRRWAIRSIRFSGGTGLSVIVYPARSGETKRQERPARRHNRKAGDRCKPQARYRRALYSGH